MLAVLAAGAVCPVAARAHAELDRAMEDSKNAEFDAALESFDRAIASGTLTRDELVLLLTERALVLHALRRPSDLTRDLARLALIAPEHELGTRAPPKLLKEFEGAVMRQGSAVTLTATCQQAPVGMRVSSVVTDLPDPSLASVRIRTRRANEPEVVHDASEAEVAITGTEPLRYSVELVGLGQVVLARVGSPDAPRMCGSTDAGEPLAATAGTERKDGKNHRLWWWIGAGGAVAIAAVTVGLVVASNGDSQASDTSVATPMVTFK